MSAGGRKVAGYRDDDGRAARGLQPLHAPRLPGGLERRRADLGLPLPRLALRRRRRGPQRPRRRAARAADANESRRSTMRAVAWHGTHDVRVDTVPDPVIEQPTDAIVRVTSTGICGSDLHLYEVLGRVHRRGRHPRPRADGRGRGGRRGGHRHRSRRPRRGPVQHLLRPLLHVRCGADVAVRDDAGARAGYGRCAARLHQALRAGARRPGRVPARAAGPVRADQGAGGPARRPLRLPLRRAAHRMAGGRVRGRPGRRQRAGARPRPDRRDGVPDRAAPRRRARHRHRPRPRAARPRRRPRRPDARHRANRRRPRARCAT